MLSHDALKNRIFKLRPSIHPFVVAKGCSSPPQVTQPGNAVAAAYLLAEFQKLEVLAKGRDDIIVQARL